MPDGIPHQRYLEQFEPPTCHICHGEAKTEVATSFTYGRLGVNVDVPVCVEHVDEATHTLQEFQTMATSPDGHHIGDQELEEYLALRAIVNLDAERERMRGRSVGDVAFGIALRALVHDDETRFCPFCGEDNHGEFEFVSEGYRCRSCHDLMKEEEST